jgi:D-methionine transport system substrate-binding protein
MSNKNKAISKGEILFMKKIEFKLRKQLLLIFTIMLSTLTIVGCGASGSTGNKETIVKIGTKTEDPKIWEALNKQLEKDNIKVQIVNFSSTNPNEALAAGEVDLNAFQHYMYFNKNIKDLNLELTSIGDMYIFPLDLYSKKLKSIDELKAGAKIAVPNDVTNTGRSLKVFAEAGLITLNDIGDALPGYKDIATNKLNLQFVELDSAQIARSLEDVDAGIVFTKNAVEAGLDPSKDPIYHNKIDVTDPKQHDYINLIAARTKDKDNEIYKKVVDAFHTDAVAQAILDQYKNAAIPAWDKMYAKK